MEKDLISIIVPVYNAEAFLEKCVTSLMRQTYPNIEIILVDDGAKDGSPALCDAYAQQDRRVVVIHQENAGVSCARNAGLARASGKYVMFVDSDDWVDEHIAEKLYTALSQRQADMAVCSYYAAVAEDRFEPLVYEPVFIEDDVHMAQYLNSMWGQSLTNAPWGTLYRRDMVGEFRVGMSFGEDTLFKVNYFSVAKSIVVISDTMYYYKCFENENSLSRRFAKDHFIHYEYLYQQALDMLYLKGGIKRKQAKNLNSFLLQCTYFFMCGNDAQSSKKESVAYIKKVCDSEAVHKAAKTALWKGGLRSAVKMLLIYWRMAGCLRWFIRCTTNKHIKKNNNA